MQMVPERFRCSDGPHPRDQNRTGACGPYSPNCLRLRHTGRAKPNPVSHLPKYRLNPIARLPLLVDELLSLHWALPDFFWAR